MSGPRSISPLTPEQFPLMRSTRAGTLQFDTAIEQIAEGLAAGTIRNVVFQDAKERLSRAVYEAWQKHVAGPHFHGRSDVVSKELYDLYWSFSVTNLHEVLSASKKMAQTKLEGIEIDAMRALLKEALPLAEALAKLKGLVTKGRAPNTGTAKPLNPNKMVRTCPVCFRAIAVVGGHMAHHGYERPEHGLQTASCPGVRFAPLEVSSDGLVWLIAALRKNLERDEELFANRATEPEYLLGRRNGSEAREKIRRGDALWPVLFQRHLGQLKERIVMNRQGIPPLETRLASWKPAAQA